MVRSGSLDKWINFVRLVYLADKQSQPSALSFSVCEFQCRQVMVMFLFIFLFFLIIIHIAYKKGRGHSCSFSLVYFLYKQQLMHIKQKHQSFF